MIVAPTLSLAASTNFTAFAVVMCSRTTRNVGKVCTSGISVRSMNTFSRSNTSIAGSVTSPCTSSGSATSAIASSAGNTLRRSVTPESELVVAPAGYSFTPCTTPLSRARRISSGGVLSVR